MLESQIPSKHLKQFAELRPGRKMIIAHYFSIKEKERRSSKYIIEKIALDLGYSVNKKGMNTYIFTVIKEFLTS